MAKYALAYGGEKIDQLLGLVDGATSNIQEQIDGIHDDIQEQINGINTELDSKASEDHTHDAYAKSSHIHKASEISGTLSIANGGTGATTAKKALENLGISKNTALIDAGWKTITPTRNTSVTPSDSTISLKYCELTNTCMVRIYVATRQSLTYKEDEEYLLYTVPEGYRPNAQYALTAYGGGTAVQAAVDSKGQINIRPRCSDIAHNYVLYVSGSWIVG